MFAIVIFKKDFEHLQKFITGLCFIQHIIPKTKHLKNTIMMFY
jgi:hypothetical protein